MSKKKIQIMLSRKKITVNEGPDRFDGNPAPHYHFSCRGCGCVMDLDLPQQDNLNKLATELAKPATGRTIYILDEPTTEDSRLLTWEALQSRRHSHSLHVTPRQRVAQQPAQQDRRFNAD